MGHVLQSRVISDLRWFVRPVRDSIVPLGATRPSNERRKSFVAGVEEKNRENPTKIKVNVKISPTNTTPLVYQSDPTFNRYCKWRTTPQGQFKAQQQQQRIEQERSRSSRKLQNAA
jgi:hypothetical protein